MAPGTGRAPVPWPPPAAATASPTCPGVRKARQRAIHPGTETAAKQQEPPPRARTEHRCEGSRCPRCTSWQYIDPKNLHDALRDAVCGMPRLFSYWRADKICLKLIQQRKKIRSIQAFLLRRVADTKQPRAMPGRSMPSPRACMLRRASTARAADTGRSPTRRTRKPNAARAQERDLAYRAGKLPCHVRQPEFTSSSARTRGSPEKQLMLSSASSPETIRRTSDTSYADQQG